MNKRDILNGPFVPSSYKWLYSLTHYNLKPQLLLIPFDKVISIIIKQTKVCVTPNSFELSNT